MNTIIISNHKIKGLTVMDFYNNKDIRKFGIHNGTSTLVPMYQELLREVLGNIVDTTFKDKPLSKEETQAIEVIFSEKIDENIPLIETPKKLPFHRRLEWKNKGYDLNLSLTSPTNRKIIDFYTIVKICRECISESKPMYLSIE